MTYGWNTDEIRTHGNERFLFITDGIRTEYGYGWDTDTWKRSLIGFKVTLNACQVLKQIIDVEDMSCYHGDWDAEG